MRLLMLAVRRDFTRSIKSRQEKIEIFSNILFLVAIRKLQIQYYIRDKRLNH